MAFANKVFPVPGGPKKIIPRGTRPDLFHTLGAAAHVPVAENINDFSLKSLFYLGVAANIIT